MFAALLTAAILAAPPGSGEPPLDAKNWEQDPHIVAVQNFVATFDANASEGEPSTRCLVASGSTAQLDNFGPFDVTTISRTDGQVKTDPSLTRSVTHFRVANHAGDGLDLDYTYTLYARDGRPLFLSVSGTDDDIVRTVSVFYGDGGKPFWSYGLSRRLADNRQQAVGRAGALEDLDWSKELAFAGASLVPDLKTLTLEAFETGLWKPCTPDEADRLLKLAPGTSAARKADRELAQRFLVAPKGP